MAPRPPSGVAMARIHLSACACVCLCACGTGEQDWGVDQEGLSCPGDTLAIGIDSVNNAVCSGMNWSQFKSAGGTFAMIKATEGDGTNWTYVNANFPSAWPGMKQAGVIRGAFAYLHPDLNGAAQAQYFYNTVKSYGGFQPGDLPPELDLEQSCPGGAACCSNPVPASQAQQVAQDFLNELESLSGMVPIIYTYDYYWVNYFGAPSSFSKYPAWWASCLCSNCNVCSTCPGTNSPPAPAAPWSRSTFWQYNWNAQITGVPNGCADTTAFNGTPAELQAWTDAQWGGGTSQLTSNDTITAVNWPTSGELEVFAVTTGATAMHVYTNGATDTWTQDYSLSGSASCGLSATMWPPPRGYYAELFDPTSTGSTQHLWWNGTSWTAFASYGAPAGVTLSHLSTLAWGDGHVEVFALGSDSQAWHNYWNYSSSAWSGWSAFGGTGLVTAPSPILWGDGHGEVFSTDASGLVWHTWSGSGSAYPGGWHAWDSFGGANIASRVVPVRWADGHVQVFARGTDDQLYQSVVNSTGWVPLAVVNAGSTIQGDPAVIMNVSGKGGTPGPEIFARDPNNQVVHAWWTGSAWGAWTPLLNQTAASDPLGWIRLDGSAAVFVVDPSGNLLRTYHDPTNGWTSWMSIGTGIDACASPSTIPPDAGTPGPDAGIPGIDAGMPEDAGSPGPDSGTSQNDAGAVVPGPDAAQSPTPDAGNTGSTVGSGCGCGTGAGDSAGFLALALAAAIRAGRRRGQGLRGNPAGAARSA
jgi:lysozyme